MVFRVDRNVEAPFDVLVEINQMRVDVVQEGFLREETECNREPAAEGFDQASETVYAANTPL